MSYLYLLVIQPIEYLIEVIFTILYRFLGSPGAALIGVSIAVSFLVLPLYIKADAIQEEEQKKQKSMEKWIKHIQRFFKKDERYMVLSSYYREAGYRPLYAIRGMISLLLQIPFFIAAYNYLSELTLLQGKSFGLIPDLGAPDGMIRLCGLSFNMLPVLMTLINCISGAIYTRGFQLKQKLQVYILAAVFLVLLYQSPSGLVVYWTMNNIFSLLKNIVMKYVKDKKRFVAILFSAISVCFIVVAFSRGMVSKALAMGDNEKVALLTVVFCLFQIPLCLYVWHIIRKKSNAVSVMQKYSDVSFKTVLWIEITAAVLLGLIIPLATVSSSPQEFTNPVEFRSPLYFVTTSALMYAGVFVIWGSVIAYMCVRKARYLYVLVLISTIVVSFINFMCYSPDNVENLTAMLEWRPTIPEFAKTTRYINLIIVAAVITLIFFLGKYMVCYSSRVCMVVLMAALVFSVIKIADVSRELKSMQNSNRWSDENRELVLSANGKNVVVIMLDAAIDAYIPYIFEYRPDLKEKFDGFVWYPNTVSMGLYTNMGAPALWGGYDYTPASINNRPEERLKDKHNEALSVLPRVLGENGYDVTVCDLPYANYVSTSDYSIYDDMSYVNAFHLKETMYSMYSMEETYRMMERNFFFYSIYKTVPLILQDEVYDRAQYLRAEQIVNPGGYATDHLQDRLSMEWVIENTEVDDEAGDRAFLYMNQMTHDPVPLQLPDLAFMEYVDNEGYDTGVPMTVGGRTMGESGTYYDASEQFLVHVCMMQYLGQWFDKLREMGIYDNTRIILVADHGRIMQQFDDMVFNDLGIDVEGVNPLLMVKDFGDEGFKTDNSFMTNADTPYLAVNGIVNDPLNPYTGNRLDMSQKEEGVEVIFSDEFFESGAEYVFGKQGDKWYSVHDNIFEKDCWEQIR